MAAPALDWVTIPADSFSMGSEEEDTDARPVHRVTLRAFQLTRCPITHAQYAAFMSATGRPAPPHFAEPRFRTDTYPVVSVTWEDASAFCRWAGGRLPTEAEWEYAARGPEGRRYPWGDEDPDPTRAVFHLDVGFGEPHPVGSVPRGASPLGLLDMAGNVFEWCADWYGAGYYAHSPAADPAGPPNGKERVIRGGSWLSMPDALHSAARMHYPPASRSMMIGFRVAR